MNDVLNSQGYTQAAYWNQIPTGAWVLMAEFSVAVDDVFNADQSG
jgi:hypothetical protein